MLILGIETSCDETAASLVQDGTKVISNIVASSQSMHAKYGGIIPDRAAREQLKSILPVIHEALNQSSVLSSRSSDLGLPVLGPSASDRLKTDKLISENRKQKTDNQILNIDALAVTAGPGLIGSLLVGVETAKSLALALNKPLVPVNHLVGHIYGNFIQEDNKESDLPTFPALILLVSGGHTELILMKNHGKFKLLGSTRDDAAGECFDKCARLLNLGYPGGPAIEAAASQVKSDRSKVKSFLPRPMINDNNFDFSFSGLKTAVAGLSRTQNLEPSHLAYELQEAATDVLVTKTIRAAEKFKPKSILLCGGVAANKRLRYKLLQVTQSKLPQVTVHVPPISLCTDNAAYIASAAFFNYHPVPWQKITADPALTI